MRTIKVKKADLIAKIKENKENHKVEYLKAVEAYKAEAKKQLKKLNADLAAGKLTLKMSMTAPSNREAEYDKLVLMFEWEVEDTVELSQGEFNEYIHDETSFAREAKFANSLYLG